MSIKAALVGASRFKMFMFNQMGAFDRATDEAVRKQVLRTKADVRADVSRAFPKSRRTPGAIRSKIYLNNQRGTAGIIYSKFGERTAAGFRDFIPPRLFGATVGPVKGKWLAIPLSTKGTRSGRNRSRRARGEALMEQGKLSFVPIHGGTMALLIHRKKSSSQIYFLLVRRVRYPGIAGRADYIRRALGKIPRDILESYARKAMR